MKKSCSNCIYNRKGRNSDISKLWCTRKAKAVSPTSVCRLYRIKGDTK